MPDSREAVIAAAEQYIIQGLVQQQPDDIPFAEHCSRRELGMVTGASGKELRELLRSEIYDPVLDAYELRWIVEGEQAVCFYKQTVTFSEEPLLVCTRFRVVDGLIEEIEILLYGKGLTDTIAQNVAEFANA